MGMSEIFFWTFFGEFKLRYCIYIHINSIENKQQRLQMVCPVLKFPFHIFRTPRGAEP